MEITDEYTAEVNYALSSDNVKYTLTEELVNYIFTPMNLIFGVYVLIKQIR